MDATTDAADLTCPLCDYSLRGLVDPRCPECGFAFTWDELRAADRARHPWLFEHGRRPSPRRLVTTWWRDARPWRFWRDVTPANPVNVRRLVAFWAVAGLVATALLLAPLPHGLAAAGDVGFLYLSGTLVPTGPHADWLFLLAGQTWTRLSADPLSPNLIGPPLLVLAWPWLSVAALLVFRLSMRQARISPAQVLRVAVYGCDFGPTVAAAVVGFVPAAELRSRWTPGADGVPLAYLALFCGGLATVRLAFAYARYLRFHRPLATVLAAQVVVVLFVWTCLTLTTDMGGLFR